jgi:hypothetical protein
VVQSGEVGMRNLVKSIFIVIFITLLQLSIYDIFLKPIITTWGASEKEVSMPMAGDDKTSTITATRAISIDRPKSEVWKWLVQLGADRGGFYSYSFIEEALGYETRQQDSITPEFKEIKVGDLVRGSINEKRSIVPYSFPVLYVDPGETFVLGNWGTFLLKEVNSQQTRLIVRTQELANKKSEWLKVASYIEVPLHFIMERRLLMGIKARVEAGENIQLSQTQDIFWFAGIVSSGFLICLFIYMARGMMQSVAISSILSFFWVCSIWLIKPIPLYSIGMSLIVCIAILSIVMVRKPRGVVA